EPAWESIESACAGGGKGSATASQGGASHQAAHQTEPQTESRSGAAQWEAPQSEARKFKKPKPRALNTQGDETPLEGEISIFMKMSWLFITLIIGVVSGAILYGYTPLPRIIDKWIPSSLAPNDGGQIQYRFKDTEVRSAFARHLEGRSDEARTRINAALTANPANAEALYCLGRVDLDQKKYDDAVTHLKEAAKLDAKLPDVWAYMATAYLGLGQSRNAMDALQRISEQPPGAPGANPQSSPTPAGGRGRERGGERARERENGRVGERGSRRARELARREFSFSRSPALPLPHSQKRCLN